MFRDYIKTPLGLLSLEANDLALTWVRFVDIIVDKSLPNKITDETKNQLTEYFSHQRKIFDLPLEFNGTDFQKMVWHELSNIKFGDTCSYADIAIAIGNPRASRAVGSANGKNLFPIIVPCHRVIAHDGSLGGYSCGIRKKAWLLQHEGRNLKS